ncbi:MAG TPA: aldo/keto reductase [Gemmataceae bacterium]|jgi:predicted aldo/keto reductase-like oxidoreductase|nr:aldo/keto reductase [Gemmataceae bacterium]
MISRSHTLPPFLRAPASAFGKPICRLGLASRGDTRPTPEDIHFAIERGVNFLNWCGCGYEDGMSRAIAELGSLREEVVVCVQFEARAADDARRELASILKVLNSSYVDVLTFYYVEQDSEWQQIIGPGGALEYCRQAQKDGLVRKLGVTTHQRRLAATMAQSGLLDCLMIRYNAAHRGAETDIFPVTTALQMPVIAYTALRWGALLQATPDDPPGFSVPPSPLWYRFALQSPAVTVALSAPSNRRELEEDLTVLEAGKPLSAAEYEQLADHGWRVRRHAGGFP